MSRHHCAKCGAALEFWALTCPRCGIPVNPDEPERWAEDWARMVEEERRGRADSAELADLLSLARGID